jgi:chemotaxis protein CheY-P-specific phosphatase CheC
MEKDTLTTPPLSMKQVAAVGQAAAIAASQAGHTLSRLLNFPVSITPSEVVSSRPGDIQALPGGLEAPAIGVFVPFRGDLEGNTLLLFPEEEVLKLAGILSGVPAQQKDDLSLSTLIDVGNILTGKLLAVLSNISGKVIVSLPPLLVQDMAGAILDSLMVDAGTWPNEVTTLVLDLADPAGIVITNPILVPGGSCLELFLEAADRLSAGQ